MSRDEVSNFDPERLRRARQQRGLTLDALGELIGVQRPSLIGYEKGRATPSPARLVVLAKVLDVDPLELTTTTAHTATLADLRVRAGLSGPATAARLEISDALYYKFESGLRSLRPEITVRLAGLLGVSVEEVTAARRRGISGRPR